MTAPIETSDHRFPGDIPTEGIAVVDFWAPWCGPCKQFGPVFVKSAAENTDVAHLKVNVDENPHLAEHFKISSIPTTVFIRDEITVGQFPGAMNSSRLNDLLAQTRTLDMNAVKAEAGKRGQ